MLVYCVCARVSYVCSCVCVLGDAAFEPSLGLNFSPKVEPPPRIWIFFPDTSVWCQHACTSSTSSIPCQLPAGGQVGRAGSGPGPESWTQEVSSPSSPTAHLRPLSTLSLYSPRTPESCAWGTTCPPVTPGALGLGAGAERAEARVGPRPWDTVGDSGLPSDVPALRLPLPTASLGSVSIGGHRCPRDGRFGEGASEQQVLQEAAP